MNNSAAAKSIKKKLPLNVSFNDSPGFDEKIADLDFKISTKGMPSGSKAKKGTIGYWSPDNRLVLYWGNVSYYQGIHVIGHLDKKTNINTIKHVKNNQSVTLKLIK